MISEYICYFLYSREVDDDLRNMVLSQPKAYYTYPPIKMDAVSFCEIWYYDSDSFPSYEPKDRSRQAINIDSSYQNHIIFS